MPALLDLDNDTVVITRVSGGIESKALQGEGEIDRNQGLPDPLTGGSAWCHKDLPYGLEDRDGGRIAVHGQRNRLVAEALREAHHKSG